jgi:pyrroloquinoline-quinone synthase
VPDPSQDQLLSPADFEQALRAVGAELYYDKHPFHLMLHNGGLNKGQVQAWALNRFCFQSGVARKDASILSRATDPEFRREWVLRVLDHDGFGEDPGGIQRWLILTDGLGLKRADVLSQRGVLPATVFAVEAYVRFARNEPLAVAIAATLTEFFSQQLHQDRLRGMLGNYDFVDHATLGYFKRRLTLAPRDASFALDYVKRSADTRAVQEACIEAIRFKCQMLWTMLDALQHAYVEGHLPPGAFDPKA